jgi:SAM-dependent methyltransferase
MPIDPVDPAIRTYYDSAPEETRLQHGASRLEELRTRELILRHGPESPATVLDVGAGAGPYSFWLAERGYEVRLIDASPRLVEVARVRNEGEKYQLSSCAIGDARALEDPEGSAEMVLLLGPLYHLVEERDRRIALTEALRVLRQGGVVIAAAISRWASALDGLSREFLRDPDFAAIVAHDMGDGRHENPTNEPEYFTTAYFHRPEDLRREVTDAGFDVEALYGIEGPGWMFPDFEERWADPDRRRILVDTARALESEPDVIGCSAHLLIVGRKR